MGVVRLRPHHLLCTLLFSGYGYDGAFAGNMARVCAGLRGDAPVRIVAGGDDICACCPRWVAERSCCGQSGAEHMDAALLARTGLALGTYAYDALRCVVAEKIDAGAFDAVCGECHWLHSGVCSYALFRERLRSTGISKQNSLHATLE